jgi:CRP-like cAMP-binding protein
MTATAEPLIGETFILHLGLIGSLSEEDKQALLSIRGETRDLKRGEDILRDGDRPSHSVVVISGLLQRYTLGPRASGRSTPSTCPPTRHVWRPSTSA